MGLTHKIAIIGHNGWAASRIVENLAAHPFQNAIRILAREGSSVASLPSNVEVARYSWSDSDSIRNGLEGIDILM